MKDDIFSNLDTIGDFKFGQDVVSVFDNMVTRSVPYYAEIQRMMSEVARDFVKSGSIVYDLGCSTGTTLINFDRSLPPDVDFVGIDNSDDMLKQCRDNFIRSGSSRHCDFLMRDLNNGVVMKEASVVVMCLTLQFVRPLYRNQLIRSIHDQLNQDGCLILVEKTLGEESLLNRLFIKYYYDFKRRNSYSDLEIANKREALENVLIPYKLMENRELLINTGFRTCEVFFKWYNFSGLIAVK